MKTKIDCIIVVEGKSDIDYLSSFIDATFYKVNGSAVSKENIEFLKNAKKSHDIVVLTDPDFPGKKIRNYINEQIPGLKNAYVRKEFSIKKHKVGVAECDKEEVLYALKNFVVFDEKNYTNLITINDLFGLGLIGKDNSKELRKLIDENYHLGHNNGKALCKKLNLLGVTKEELEELLNAKNK